LYRLSDPLVPFPRKAGLCKHHNFLILSHFVILLDHPEDEGDRLLAKVRNDTQAYTASYECTKISQHQTASSAPQWSRIATKNKQSITAATAIPFPRLKPIYRSTFAYKLYIRPYLTFWRRNYFFILAHPVYKM